MTENRLVINGVYRHFKGNEYIVIDKAIYTENSEIVVVYKRRDTINDGQIHTYARPLDMFLSEVDHEKYPDVKQKYRFELIG